MHVGLLGFSSPEVLYAWYRLFAKTSADEVSMPA